MQQHNWHTSGLHMFELIPVEGNELVCKLSIYRWNGDGWKFESLEAVYFKDSETKENYIRDLLRRFSHGL